MDNVLELSSMHYLSYFYLCEEQSCQKESIFCQLISQILQL